MCQLAMHASKRPCQAWNYSVSWQAKPESRTLINENESGQSSHGANLCELGTLHARQQVSSAGGFCPESGLEHVQRAVPPILVAAVEKEFELRIFKNEPDHRPKAETIDAEYRQRQHHEMGFAI